MKEEHKKLKVMVMRHHDASPSVTKPKSDTFHKISVKISNKLGSATAFYIALLVIVVWAITGPLFHFSNTWQLVINTGTTIVTFLMVFVIQNTQNRDGKAMQLKLDELIQTSRSARAEFVDVEDLTDAELDEMQEEFHHIHERIYNRAPNSKSKK